MTKSNQFIKIDHFSINILFWTTLSDVDEIDKFHIRWLKVGYSIWFSPHSQPKEGTGPACRCQLSGLFLAMGPLPIGAVGAAPMPVAPPVMKTRWPRRLG
jgi:hypothetical protein